MKKLRCAAPEALLELSVAVIELYFRLEAATQAIAGFAHAGGEWGIMRSLILNGDQTVPGMARARPVSRQHCQGMVNRLCEQGLVEFVENPKHRRSHFVSITKKGRVRFQAMTDQFLTAEAAFTPHFKAEEVAQAIEVLRRAHALLAL
ncbi:MAG: MarR family transcriptional regulator [Terricaulis sp.]